MSSSAFPLALNTGTTPNLDLREAVEVTAEAGLTHIGPWRHLLEGAGGAETAAKIIAGAGLKASTLCRGGFLTATEPEARAAALESNRAAIREAATIGTDSLIMVVGGLPAAAHVLGGEGDRGDKDIAAARARVGDGLADLVPYAQEHGVRLVLEPLHPMYAADRAVLSTLGQALDMAAGLPADAVAVVVDTFHVYWDPQVREQIARAGAEGRLASYQVCDFNLPIAADALKSRGMMGDGYIDFASLSTWTAQAGYTGPVEVEIFNQEVNDQDPRLTLATMKERYVQLVLPHLESARAGAPAETAAGV
ncbi:sugar phosphate isomerase/epimerase family protein [Zhihengliuella halotolerans]|uniref:Sugar phosphate isomerase/epimerase n=1 Tax=Zhihengliuella halotolerans TaxID=370736 RepID=A0A4Q8AE28_9MICC|nr:sugar phosphate isomerase/epimerase family protein [Zhihengliuella halotolerans]RZU62520.1 sugar phosphate isomerase/epimerase [Zhihengliuella halotolerans]